MHITINIRPCITYSTTPTLSQLKYGDIASNIMNAGAAIIDIPRLAFIDKLTPSAINTVPNIHISSDVLGIFFNNFGSLFINFWLFLSCLLFVSLC